MQCQGIYGRICFPAAKYKAISFELINFHIASAPPELYLLPAKIKLLCFLLLLFWFLFFFLTFS